MPLIDPRTLIILAGAMSGLMSLVFYALWRKYPATIQGLGKWAFSMLAFWLGGLLIGARGTLPDVVALPFGIFLIWSGLYLGYVGTQQFFGVTPRIVPWVLTLLAALVVQLWFTVGDPNYPARLRMSNVMMSALFAVHAILIFKQGALTFAKGLAMLVLTTTALIQLTRFLTSFNLAADASLMDTTPVNIIYLISFGFAMLLFSISAVLMATERLLDNMEHLATHDSLTNALTRRHMNDACENELERCRRHGRHMALLMIDMDHFKNINDTFGHQAGDKVLVEFVAKVNQLLRGADLLARFGGEEFLILLPDTSREEAEVVAERIRETCAQAQQGPTCTVSIGLTTNHKENDTVDSLLARADAAMYQAKANGRNRVDLA
jgi:diguanylate cyclase (GGDEF)-like protein